MEGQIYYFAATGYSENEESDYSVEVVYAVPVAAVSVPPVVSGISLQGREDTPVACLLEANSQENTDLGFTIVSQPTHGILTAEAGTDSFTDTPTPDGSGEDFFAFLTTDGKVSSNLGTVNILINEVTNDFPFEVGELLVTSDWQYVSFSKEFSFPSVVVKPTTMNDPATGTLAIRNLTSKGFDIRLREWDYLDGLHPEEIISIIAMERGHHQLADNVDVVSECTALLSLNTFKAVTFSNALPNQPVVLASIVTDNDSNAATCSIKDITPQGFYITLQEQEDDDIAEP